MLIPQYSIRWLLGVTAVCGVAFTFVGLAVRGQAWAMGISAALVALCVAMLLYAAMFGVLWLFSLVFLGSKQEVGSPFAPASPESSSHSVANRQEEAVDAILVD